MGPTETVLQHAAKTIEIPEVEEVQVFQIASLASNDASDPNKRKSIAFWKKRTSDDGKPADIVEKDKVKVDSPKDRKKREKEREKQEKEREKLEKEREKLPEKQRKKEEKERQKIQQKEIRRLKEMNKKNRNTKSVIPDRIMQESVMDRLRLDTSYRATVEPGMSTDHNCSVESPI